MSGVTIHTGYNCDVCQMWWHKADHCPQCAGEDKGRIDYPQGIVVIPPQNGKPPPNIPCACIYCNRRFDSWLENCDCEEAVKRRVSGQPAKPQPSILTEAASLISGERHESYGDYKDEAALIATGWEALRRGGPITARHVPLMMTWLKMVRESHGHKRDNLVDAAGYLALANQLYDNQTSK